MPERPRDHLGRPLPAGSDPAAAGPVVVDVTGLDDGAVWRTAMDYLDEGLPFHAHEVFEQRWRTAEASDRAAWRALAQWGAALTHAARGNELGAQRLATRAMATLDEAVRVPDGVDARAVRTSCATLIGSP